MGTVIDMAAYTHRKRAEMVEPIPAEQQWGTSIMELMAELNEQVTALYEEAVEAIEVSREARANRTEHEFRLYRGDFTCKE